MAASRAAIRRRWPEVARSADTPRRSFAEKAGTPGKAGESGAGQQLADFALSLCQAL